MPRKKWVPQTDITPSLLKFREKKKWQIALRRYVIEQQACVPYAPYFGLDIKTMRAWFETQFEDGIGWDDFGKAWRFDHLIPVACFDFNDDDDLQLCWNFTNIRVELLSESRENGPHLNFLAAKGFFKALHDATQYAPCLKLLKKISTLEGFEKPGIEKQQAFIRKNKNYLDVVEGYSSFEFELINSGRSIEDVMKEVNFLKKF
ncbi:MAG: hypothetical protein ABJB86_16950 [Bacteroidota bacterium]